MVRDMTEAIFIIAYDFIKVPQRLSTQRVDNLENCCRGHIIAHYCKFQIKQPVTGMRKKPQSRLGMLIIKDRWGCRINGKITVGRSPIFMQGNRSDAPHDMAPSC